VHTQKRILVLNIPHKTADQITILITVLIHLCVCVCVCVIEGHEATGSISLAKVLYYKMTVELT
jgi:hypothetical protein